tara:strand:+ start:202 stop:696 length:495 start_codon:yes stop_codon:yes gene_type:complete
VKFNPYPTPPHLFRQYEKGEISREELHASMALHARGLIEEMEEANKNPKTSYLERLRNHAAVRKIVKKHGRAVLREALAILGDIADFPPAQILWNASHGSVPLHCFIRSRIEPVFRITRFDVQPMFISMEVEYGAHAKDKTTRESFLLQRDAALNLEVAERIQL